MTPNHKVKLIVVLNALTLIGAILTVLLLLRIFASAARQSAHTNDSIVASQKVTEKELRCLASFFSQTNRQNIRISNLETCEILHTDTGKTEVLSLSPTPNKTQSSPAVPSNDTNKNSTTTPTPTQVKTSQTGTSQTTAPSQTAPQVQAQGQATTDTEATVDLQGGHVQLQGSSNLLPKININTGLPKLLSIRL